MTYEEVKNLMPANRRWCKWVNCVYLQRFRGAIRIRYGYRYRHSQVMATWYPNGTFKFASICYYPSQRWRVNYFMPGNYIVSSHRYYSFLANGHGDEPRAFYIRSIDRHGERHLASKDITWVIIRNGVVQTKLGPTLSEVKSTLKTGDIERDKPRRRWRYWLRKARGIYRHPCGKSYIEGCAWRKIWPRPTTAWKGECGCEVYTKKAISRDTVETILAEQNATVRTAKIQIYGIEKFFADANAVTIDKEAGYELMTLDTGRAHREVNRWNGREQTANVVLTALRMSCSTTGKVYVNTVPPEIRRVSAALDWMFNVERYLERVGKQT